LKCLFKEDIEEHQSQDDFVKDGKSEVTQIIFMGAKQSSIFFGKNYSMFQCAWDCRFMKVLVEMHSLRQTWAKMENHTENLLKYHERARGLAQIIASA
jgi:hypothetical protein